jgi:hypothetical protein
MKRNEWRDLVAAPHEAMLGTVGMAISLWHAPRNIATS